MTVSGYRLPQQIPGQSMSQQQPQDGNGVISKTELNRSDSTIGISSDTTVTSLPVQHQQLGIMASLTGSGGLNRSTSLNDPTTHQRLSASSSNSSSSSSSAQTSAVPPPIGIFCFLSEESYEEKFTHQNYLFISVHIRTKYNSFVYRSH